MKKRKSYLLLSLAALACVLAVFFINQNIDSFVFQRLTRQYFVQTLENDALTLHYTLAEPKRYGIRLSTASLPVYSKEAQQQSLEQTGRFYQNLNTIRAEKLSEDDRRTYELLSSYVKKELAGSRFSYYEEPLSPTSGIHTEMPLLLAEYTFRSIDDVKTYLELLSSIPAWLEGLAEYETQKSRAGLFMPKEDAFKVAAQCGQLFSEADLAQNSHFLQTTFSDRLDQLLSDQLLTEVQQKQFIAENDRILTTLVVSAYQKLGETLIALSENSTQPGGLCRFPQGREYYAWLLDRSTGCSMDPDRLFLLLKKRFRQEYERLQTLTEHYCVLTGSSPDFSLLTDSFLLTAPDSILSDLQQKMAQDFPSLSVLSKEDISCTIKDVDEALEAFTSPAYYMTPPADAPAENTICINRAATTEGVELYTTLAHEGYPGHLYQTVYSALSMPDGALPVRELLYYGGYTEGWAYYAERISYSYAGQLLAQDLGIDSESALILCELASLHRDLQINFFCMLDIALHYQGASRDTVLQSLSSLGIGASSAGQIYDYLRTSPTAYMKYYVGYLEMLALRTKAKELWGDSYTPLRFHTFILENGPSDFASLFDCLTHSSSMLSR